LAIFRYDDFMIRGILNDEINKAIKNLYSDFAGALILGKTSNPEFGDYGVSLISLASKIKRKPREVAEEIRQTLRSYELSNRLISKIEFAPPGFLNFWLSEKGLKEGLKNLDKSASWRTSLPAGRQGKKIKISLDYLDANPTGPIHLGHARSGFFGDCLSNILEFYGYKVSREFYVNNAKSNKQIQSLGETALGQGEEYKHEQLLKILEKTEVKKKLSKIKDSKEAGFYIAGLIQKENEVFLGKTAEIKFDLFFEEEKVYASGLLDEILEKLKKSGTTYEKDGALWFKSAQYGDSEDRVLIRSNGEPTYVLPDIAYHWDRLMKRKYDKAVNIFGADHFGYGPRLKGALEALGAAPERIKMIIYQMVRLVKAGKEVKMSKRTGEFVTLQELINEVGLDAARFFFLARSIDTHMDFDLDLAKERSKKNPVYYVQYAHARACSIMRNSSIKFKIFKPQLKIKNSNKFEHNLIMKIIQFPEIIEDTARDYQVRRLPQYALDLVRTFHKFYEECKVLDDENKEITQARLALCEATRIVIKNTLDLMGINAPEKM